jgi:hypothetical protein
VVLGATKVENLKTIAENATVGLVQSGGTPITVNGWANFQPGDNYTILGYYLSSTSQLYDSGWVLKDMDLTMLGGGTSRFDGVYHKSAFAINGAVNYNLGFNLQIGSKTVRVNSLTIPAGTELELAYRSDGGYFFFNFANVPLQWGYLGALDTGNLLPLFAELGLCTKEDGAVTYRDKTHGNSEFQLGGKYKIDITVTAQNRETLVEQGYITKTVTEQTTKSLTMTLESDGSATFTYDDGTGATEQEATYVATEIDGVPTILYVLENVLSTAQIVGGKLFVNYAGAEFVLTK